MSRMKEHLIDVMDLEVKIDGPDATPKFVAERAGRELARRMLTHLDPERGKDVILRVRFQLSEVISRGEDEDVGTWPLHEDMFQLVWYLERLRGEDE